MPSKQDAPEDAGRPAHTGADPPAWIPAAQTRWGTRTHAPAGHLLQTLTLNLEPPAVGAVDLGESFFQCSRFTQGKPRLRAAQGPVRVRLAAEVKLFFNP